MTADPRKGRVAFVEAMGSEALMRRRLASGTELEVGAVRRRRRATALLSPAGANLQALA